MSWTDLLIDARPINAIFSQPPRLGGVRILELRLHQDGPRLSALINLNELPEQMPPKWAAQGVNQIQLMLMFIGIVTLNIRNWTTDNIVDLELARSGDLIRVEMRGHNFETTLECGHIFVEKISGYRVGD